MGKVQKAFNVLYLLKNRGKMTARELSEELDCSEKTIRNIINEIDDRALGVVINRIQGRYGGGYELAYDCYITNFGLSNEELISIKRASPFLSSKSGFTMHKEYKRAVDKIIAKSKLDTNLDFVGSVHYRGINNVPEIEKYYYDMISDAIIEKHVITVKYFSIASRKISYRKIHPYKLYCYKGFNYIAGYCEFNNEVRDFKLSRIKDIKVEDEIFEIDLNFDINKYLCNSFGIFKGDKYDIKLRIRYPYSEYIKESILHPNQKITVINEDEILFEVTMTGKSEIISWIKSMGSYVEVIKPLEIRKSILEDIENLIKTYNKNFKLSK